MCLVTQLCLTLCDPRDCSPPGFSVHGDSPGRNTGVGCHSILQGIFPTQGSNPGLLHFRQILYHLGFPHSSVGKESACRAGGPWFNSWVRKILWRRDRIPTPVFLGFPGGSAGKESACNAEEPQFLIPRGARFPGKEIDYPRQYSWVSSG